MTPTPPLSTAVADPHARELAHAATSPVPIKDSELAAFHRFCDCCEDSDAGGHDVDKAMMSQLVRIGLVRPAGPGRHETTKFGDWLRDAAAPASDIAAAPEPVNWRAKCEAMIDIWDDEKNPPESRCYVEGSFRDLIDEIRTALLIPAPGSATAGAAAGTHISDRRAFAEWFNGTMYRPDAEEAMLIGWQASAAYAVEEYRRGYSEGMSEGARLATETDAPAEVSPPDGAMPEPDDEICQHCARPVGTQHSDSCQYSGEILPRQCAAQPAEGSRPMPRVDQFATYDEYKNAMDAYDADMRIKPVPAEGSAQVAKPGKSAVFATNILGGPMREYAPGKWENAIWPSEVAASERSDTPAGWQLVPVEP